MGMKRKWGLFIFAVFLAAGVTGLLVFRGAAGRRPFKDLQAEEIASAVVRVTPPDKEATLNREDIGRLAGILRAVTIYRRDSSYREYAGQAVVYTITKTDGTVFTVQAYNPFLVWDGEGYRTEYDPCEALSALGNGLLP